MSSNWSSIRVDLELCLTLASTLIIQPLHFAFGTTSTQLELNCFGIIPGHLELELIYSFVPQKISSKNA